MNVEEIDLRWLDSEELAMIAMSSVTPDAIRKIAVDIILAREI